MCYLSAIKTDYIYLGIKSVWKLDNVTLIWYLRIRYCHGLETESSIFRPMSRKDEHTKWNSNILLTYVHQLWILWTSFHINFSSLVRPYDVCFSTSVLQGKTMHKIKGVSRSSYLANVLLETRHSPNDNAQLCTLSVSQASRKTLKHVSL